MLHEAFEAAINDELDADTQKYLGLRE
jgi:hypothetical protein